MAFFFFATQDLHETCKGGLTIVLILKFTYFRDHPWKSTLNFQTTEGKKCYLFRGRIYLFTHLRLWLEIHIFFSPHFKMDPQYLRALILYTLKSDPTYRNIPENSPKNNGTLYCALIWYTPSTFRGLMTMLQFLSFSWKSCLFWLRKVGTLSFDQKKSADLCADLESKLIIPSVTWCNWCLGPKKLSRSIFIMIMMSVKTEEGRHFDLLQYFVTGANLPVLTWKTDKMTSLWLSFLRARHFGPVLTSSDWRNTALQARSRDMTSLSSRATDRVEISHLIKLMTSLIQGYVVAQNKARTITVANVRLVYSCF